MILSGIGVCFSRLNSLVRMCVSELGDVVATVSKARIPPSTIIMVVAENTTEEAIKTVIQP